MDENQERLISQGLRRGEPQAWREFYDAFAERVWNEVARRLGPASADVADVVQETFLAAARSARSFDEAKGSLWNWLSGIARNHLALHFRKRLRLDRVALESSLTSLDGRVRQWLESPESAHDALALKELAGAVRQTLALLPTEYAAALTAKYLDDVPVEKMAREERSSEAAIRSRLARARAAFKEAFAGHVGEMPV